MSNRLTTWQQLFYRYDAWGNLVSRRHGQHEQHYAYDADNRLISARGRGPEGEFTAHYHYDALGRRVRKTVDYRNRGTETTHFLWQGYRLLQEQRDNATRRTWSYDPASPWAPLAAIEQAGNALQADIYWLHTDLNSAPLEVTDAGGNRLGSGQCSTPGKLHGQAPGKNRTPTGPIYTQRQSYTRILTLPFGFRESGVSSFAVLHEISTVRINALIIPAQFAHGFPLPEEAFSPGNRRAT